MLGLTINSQLTNDNEFKQQCRSTCAKLNSIIRKFLNCNFSVNYDQIKSLLINICGIALWVNYKKSTYNSM